MVHINEQQIILELIIHAKISGKLNQRLHGWNDIEKAIREPRGQRVGIQLHIVIKRFIDLDDPICQEEETVGKFQILEDSEIMKANAVFFDHRPSEDLVPEIGNAIDEHIRLIVYALSIIFHASLLIRAQGSVGRHIIPADHDVRVFTDSLVI